MKLCIIGGGSSYTPELIDGIIKKTKDKEIYVDNVYLMDVDKSRLSVVGEFVKFMCDGQDAKFKVVLTNSLSEALDNADFVINQIRVGGNYARHLDYLIAKKWGVIGQETTGAGGFASALRTIPVVSNILKEIEKKCPKCWLINFANPVSIIAQFIGNYSNVKWVGLCNVPKDMSMSIANLLGYKDDKNLYLDYIGLNHLSWVKKVYLNNRDVTEKVLASYRKISRMKNIPEEYFLPELIESLKMIPSSYLLYYYNQTKMLEKQRKEKVDRATEVMKIEKKLFEIYRKKQKPDKPKLLEERGGAYYSVAAVNLISSIYNNRGDTHILNCLNKNAINDLSPNVSIETNCIVKRNKIIPEKKGNLPVTIKGLVTKVKCYETLTIEAAVEKSKKKAFLALLNHPLIPDSYVAKGILMDVIKYYSKYINLK